MITDYTLKQVDEEIKRYQRRWIELVNAMHRGTPYSDHPLETAALRRASMDLTRALAVLRRTR